MGPTRLCILLLSSSVSSVGFAQQRLPSGKQECSFQEGKAETIIILTNLLIFSKYYYLYPREGAGPGAVQVLDGKIGAKHKVSALPEAQRKRWQPQPRLRIHSDSVSAGPCLWPEPAPTQTIACLSVDCHMKPRVKN